MTGNWDYFFEGKKAWRSMKRVGFKRPTNRGQKITGGKSKSAPNIPAPTNTVRTRPSRS